MQSKTIFIAIALLLSVYSHAQDPITAIIRAGIKKIIVAVDLKIQKLQNKTIWLQNAQTVMENQLSKLKLAEISGWGQKQTELYRAYFDELRTVKLSLSNYQRVKDIISGQAVLLREHREAWTLFRADKNFSAAEIQYMSGVYDGMLRECGKTMDLVLLVVNAYTTQMTDGRRMEIIDNCASSVEQSLADLREFNKQNKLLSVQRAAARGEIEYVKKLYGL